MPSSATLSVAIRTMILDQNRLHLFAGGAIVADSDAQDEYEETQAKAAGMLRALGCDHTCQTVGHAAEGSP